MKHHIFAQLFRKYRLRSEYDTLSSLAEKLYEEGVVFDYSLFSRWQNGDRIPDRKTHISLSRLFLKKKALTTINEVNVFMASAGHGYLTDSETKILFNETFITNNTNEQSQSIRDQEFEILLRNIEYSYDPLVQLEEQVDHLFNAMYSGHITSYKNFDELIELINSLKLNKIKEGINLLNRIYCLRLDFISCSVKPKDYKKIVRETDYPILFAKENNTSELGQSFSLKFKMLRLAYLASTSQKIASEKIHESIELANLAISNIPKSKFIDRFRTNYSFAKFCLLIKNDYLFKKHLFLCFESFDKLPQNMFYLKAFPWMIKALGEIRFHQNITGALENIKNGIVYVPKSCRLTYLFCQTTLYHTLVSSKDETHSKLANILKEKIVIQNSIIGDNLELLRMSDKTMVGLA